MDIEVPKNELANIDQENLNDFMEFTKSAKSKNSLRAYFYAWKKFGDWCTDKGYNMLEPGMPIELLVGLFISDMAKNRKLKPASIQTYLAGLKHGYEECGHNLDTRHPKIRAAMSGIRRTLGKKQTQKLALKTDAIKKIISSIDQNSLIGLRDRAMILLGFAGAFRRSELVAIDVEDCIFDTHGLSVYIRKSKTDQEGEGRIIDIPFASSDEFCAVRTLRRWIALAGISEGPIFVQVHKGGQINRVRICDHTVARVLKKRSEPFGFSADIAGHSLRAGHVTSAITKGTPETWIMRQTGHTNINTLRKYERLKREFVANSAANLDL